MLIFKSVRQFVRHDHALLVRRTPVRDVELLGLGVVKPFNLFGKHVYHERIKVESLGEQTERFGSACVGIALGGIFFFVHLLDNIGANSLARPQ